MIVYQPYTQWVPFSPSTNPSTNQPINPPMNQLVNQPTNPIAIQPTNQSINQPMNVKAFSPTVLSMPQSTDQSMYQPIMQQPIDPSTGRWVAVPINQPMNQSMNQSINPSVPMTLVSGQPMQHINQPTQQPINQSIPMGQTVAQLNQSINPTNQSIDVSTHRLNLAHQADQSINQGHLVQALIFSLQSIHQKTNQSTNQSTNASTNQSPVIDHCVLIGRSVTAKLFSSMKTSATQRDLLVEELLQSINQSTNLFQECDQSVWSEFRAVLSKAFSFHKEKRSVISRTNQSTSSARSNQSTYQSTNQSFQLNYQPSISHSFPSDSRTSALTQALHQSTNHSEFASSPTTNQSINHSPNQSTGLMTLANQSINFGMPPLQSVPDQSTNQSIVPATIITTDHSPPQSMNQSINPPFKLRIRPSNQLTSSTIKCKFCGREWPLSASKDAESLVQRNRQLKSKRDHTPFCKDNPLRNQNLAKRRAKKSGKKLNETNDQSTNEQTNNQNVDSPTQRTNHSHSHSNEIVFDDQSESSSSMIYSDDESEQTQKPASTPPAVTESINHSISLLRSTTFTLPK